MKPVRLGVSSCLLGEPTRYDGGEVTNTPLVRWLDGRAETLSLCPEVGAQMPVPRPPIHLIEKEGGVRAVDRESGAVDMTDRLVGWAEREGAIVETLDGLLLKSRSPSCGVTDTPLVGADRTGAGIFAGWVMERFPHLPLIDEEGWEDEAKRALWWKRVTAHATRRD